VMMEERIASAAWRPSSRFSTFKLVRPAMTSPRPPPDPYILGRLQIGMGSLHIGGAPKMQ
jgi:hypothetical protein